MKRVFSSSDQVIHLWANQSQNDARCKNVFFKGNKIWSYGYHYLLGEIVEYKGYKIAFINNEGYSITTSQHIRRVKNGVSHLFSFCVDGSNWDNTKNFIETCLLKEQSELIDHLFDFFKELSFHGKPKNYSIYSSRSRPRSRCGEYELNEIQSFNKKAKTLGFSHLALDLNKEYDSLRIEHVVLRQLRQKELTSPENIAKREAKKEKQKTSSIEKWRKGSPITNTVRSLEPQLIRVNGDVVETSKGASVPLAEAKDLLKNILNNKAQYGMKVGSFTFNLIVKTNNDILAKIGCHTISVNEAKKVLNTVKSELTLINGSKAS